MFHLRGQVTQMDDAFDTDYLVETVARKFDLNVAIHMALLMQGCSVGDFLLSPTPLGRSSWNRLFPSDVAAGRASP